VIQKEEGWTDSPEITIVRSKALLSVVGTMNLIYNTPTKPWNATITIDTDGTEHEFVPSGVYDRITSIENEKNYAIKEGCGRPFPAYI
jgi:hypothetical protein